MTSLPDTLMAQYRERLAIPGIPDGGPNDMKDEMPLLLKYAQEYPGVRLLEIGVRSGQSTSAGLAAAARSMGGGHLWSVDMAVPQVPGEWYSCGYWTFRQDRSENVVPELLGWPSSYHVVFVDGDHSRAGVLADARRYVPYVAKGGVALFHDVKLRNTSLPGEPCEVAQALDDFCAEYHLAGQVLPWRPGISVPPRPLAWADEGGYYGLGVIRSPNG